jgi:hypothetical protein
MMRARKDTAPEMAQCTPLYAVVHEQTVVWQVSGWRGDRPLLVPLARYRLGGGYNEQDTTAVPLPATGRFCPEPGVEVTYAERRDDEVLMSTIKPWLRTDDGLDYYAAGRRQREREEAARRLREEADRRERDRALAATGGGGMRFFPTPPQD